MTDILGNNKSDNYEEIVASLIEHYRVAYWAVECQDNCIICLSLRLFRPNLRDVSEEHGERSHQDIQTIAKSYLGRCDAALMGDYIWSLVRADSSSSHKRKCTSSLHF